VCTAAPFISAHTFCKDGGLPWHFTLVPLLAVFGLYICLWMAAFHGISL
jgi:hypothetical protein